MKIRWILAAAAGIVALAGAQTGQRSATAKAPVVRAVEFRNFHDVPVKEIVNRLNDRDIRLVQRPYSAEYVETAPTVTSIPPHAVRVTFTAAP